MANPVYGAAITPYADGQDGVEEMAWELCQGMEILGQPKYAEAQAWGADNGPDHRGDKSQKEYCPDR